MVSSRQSEAPVDLDVLQATAAAIGGRWKTSILACLARGPHRFAALRRAIGGISEKVLIQALKDLEADHLITRTVEAVVPPRVEYAMTDHGRSLCDLVRAMAEWGETHRHLRGSQPAQTANGRASTQTKAGAWPVEGDVHETDD
jgi:DNA-binding HxlR family transcriptional regulator